MTSRQLDEAIYRAIRAVPRGRVATYGQIAELAGRPGAHRAVARALRRCPPRARLPWHRIVGRHSRTRAKVSIPDPETAERQRARLMAEGVVLDEGARICLRTYGWLPCE